MSLPEIKIWIYGRPSRSYTIEERHTRLVERMLRIGPPLGWKDLEPPLTPGRKEQLAAVFGMKYPIKGLRCIGKYESREWTDWADKGSYDEYIAFKFRVSNKCLDYKNLIKFHLSSIIAAFEAYNAVVVYDFYRLNYHGGLDNNNPTYNALLADPLIDVDGRNNIYTLHPAQFWDGELCRRALGFDRDEVIRRLKDVAVVAKPLMDGVYLVLNDDPHLTYEAYVEMNERIKPMLGLHYGPSTKS